MASALELSEADTSNMLADSKYESKSEQYASSLTMKAFLQIMEDRVKQNHNEISFVKKTGERID